MYTQGVDRCASEVLWYYTVQLIGCPIALLQHTVIKVYQTHNAKSFFLH